MGYQPPTYVIKKDRGFYFVISPSSATVLGCYYTLRGARKRIKQLVIEKDGYIIEKYDKNGNLIV